METCPLASNKSLESFQNFEGILSRIENQAKDFLKKHFSLDENIMKLVETAANKSLNSRPTI